MFTTVFPPVLTPILLRQADIKYVYIHLYIIYFILYIYVHFYIYMSEQAHTAARGGNQRPRQDRGDARRGKSGPLCANLGECLERG